MLSSFRRVARRLFSTTSDAHAALWDVQAAAPLIVDPYLPLLLEALPAPAWQPEAAAARAALADVMAVRSRSIDRWLETPSWPPVRTTRRQIVLFHSALDTKAYRLGLGQSMKIFEVDADAALLARKREVLDRHGHVPRTATVDVGASPTEPRACATALLAAGFDPRVPTRWVVAGPLLDGIGASAGASAALFEIASELGSTPASGLAAQVLEPAWVDHLAALGMPAPPASAELSPLDASLDACRRAGWREKRTLRQADFASAYGRTPHEAFALLFADADSDP